ncbi:MAG: penicillin-binding protein activator, partial [Alishewanella aestuarii]
MKTSKLKPVFLLSCAALLSSCAQTPAPSELEVSAVERPQVVAPTKPDPSVTPRTDSAESLLQQAASESGERQQRLLLRASRQALAEQNAELALAISDSLQLSETTAIRSANQLPLLQAYLAHSELSLAERLVQNTNPAQLPLADRPAFLWASASLYQQLGRSYAAARALLQLDQLLADSRQAEPGYPELQAQLWQQLSNLDNTELNNLKVGASQRSLGWLNLLELVRNYLGAPQQLQFALADWQQRYPQLPSLRELPA